MTGECVSSVVEITARVAANPGSKLLILPPLIHGAAQWSVMMAITTGQTLVFPTVVDHLDADEVVRTIERVKRHLNPRLENQGVVLTMFDKRKNLSGIVAEDK